jgi:hypothetical protein
MWDAEKKRKSAFSPALAGGARVCVHLPPNFEMYGRERDK